MAVVTSTRAKQPVSVIAGPYGHPFHPILVTIPVGAWVASLIFDVASMLGDGSSALVQAAFWLIGIGILGALLAASFGVMDLATVPRRSRAFRVGVTHGSLNVAITLLFVVDFFWRFTSNDHASKTTPGQLALTAVGVAALSVSGWLGGMLSYRYGVRVADETAQADGFEHLDVGEFVVKDMVHHAGVAVERAPSEGHGEPPAL
jgi:uncharacterized membrane protein